MKGWEIWERDDEDSAVAIREPAELVREVVEQNKEVLIAHLAARSIDVAVISRPDTATWATGAWRRWEAGTGRSEVACIVTTRSGEVWFPSGWTAGLPADARCVAPDPVSSSQPIRSIDGLLDQIDWSSAQRIGMDGVTPAFFEGLRRRAPAAEIVPIDDLIWELRAVKSDGEVQLIRRACAMATSSHNAAVLAVARGGSIRDARAAAMQRLGRMAILRPSTGVQIATWGKRLSIDVGVQFHREGVFGRSHGPPDHSPLTPAATAVALAARAGAVGRDLVDAVDAETTLRVRGSGVGAELPIIDSRRGLDTPLVAGMVLSVELRRRSRYQRDLVFVGETHGELFSS